MNRNALHITINIFTAAVWLINGLICKVLNLVPRHEQIVGRILGSEFAKPLTILIGIAEIIMAIWILSGFKSKLNAVLQILTVAVMNILEYFLVPDLLLWGKANVIIAAMFIGLIYYNRFILKKENLQRK